MAAVLKTVVRQRTGGSNPSASAKKLNEGLLKQTFLFYVYTYLSLLKNMDIHKTKKELCSII